MSTGRSRITGLLHTALCLSLGAMLVLLFGADASRSSPVPAGMDAAAQRLRMEDQLERLNGKMDELILLLRSGHVKVTCLPADTDRRGPKHGWTDESNLAPSGGAAPAGGYTR